MNPAVQQFFQSKRFAVMGVSRSGNKFGNAIFKELKERGYTAYIVHPQAGEIGGEKCYPSLTSLEGKVDGVVICMQPAQASAALREAAQAGIKNVWLQQGSQNPEVIALAKELGLEAVAGKCILMYADPVRSIHGFHRTIAKIFGQY